ncbi:hypothetical protein Hdeb2414_s0002g00059211 [Helianthus debilis subsp. tardiflorus]
MGIRVLSGVHFLEVLAYLLPLCNEDTSPVTPALIISGCDIRLILLACLAITIILTADYHLYISDLSCINIFHHHF